MENLQTYEEQTLIGSIMFNPDILEKIPKLIPEYFEEESHRVIFGKIQELYNEGKEITPLNVYKRVKQIPEYIAELSGMMIGKSVAIRYGRDIYENGKKRYLKEKVSEIAQNSENPDEDIANILDRIRTPEEKNQDYISETLNTLQRKKKNPGSIFGIKSGIKGLDELTNGFSKGGLYVCAGRSSMGKSAFMTSCIAEIEKNAPVGVISLEMTAMEIVTRVCCVRKGIPYWVIDKGKASSNQFDSFAEEALNLKKLIIDDRGGLNCVQVCAKIKEMVKEKGAKIVFIDHCGLIKITGTGNLAHEIGKTTSALKSLAKELEIPIVLLCQVNRGVEGEKDKRPKLSDLRDSGRIEEDADCVFFMYREDYYKHETVKKRYENAEILVWKNRNGACGIVKCVFDNQVMKFYDE